MKDTIKKYLKITLPLIVGTVATLGYIKKSKNLPILPIFYLSENEFNNNKKNIFLENELKLWNLYHKDLFNLEKFNIQLLELNKSNIENILDEPVIVNIGSPSCTPCLTYANKFRKISNKYKESNLIFAKMNLDKNRSTISRLVEENVIVEKPRKIPCTILLDKGKEIDRIYGVHPDSLDKRINEYY